MEEENIVVAQGGKLKYLLKYNTCKLKRKNELKAYAKSIQKLGEQLTDIEEEKNYWKDRADLRLEQIRKLKERIKELEIGTPHKK